MAERRNGIPPLAGRMSSRLPTRMDERHTTGERPPSTLVAVPVM